MFNTKTIVVLAAMSGGMWTAPALAQDGEDEPFSGIYVGGQVGYDVQGNDVGSNIGFDRDGDGDFDDAVLTTTGANAFSTGFCNGRARGPTRAPDCENDRSRISYYGRVGFDQQFGSIVVGALGEFGRPGVTDYVTGFTTTPASYTFSRRLDWEASARVRAGFAANDTLFYGTGGVGYAKIDNNFFTTNLANTFTQSGDEEEFGFIVGGGLEQKISENISIGVEYTYHDYKDNDFRVRVGRGTAPATNPFVLPPDTTGTTFKRSDENFRWHSVRAGVNFRF